MNLVIYLLSVTASAADDGTCNLHLRWTDGVEAVVGQNDVLGVYTASARQRSAGLKAEPPHSNSQPWCAWFLGYADAYDRKHGAPPTGFVAPIVEETGLFPTNATGIAPVTDPKLIRRAALEDMGPKAYRAAAKAAGVVGFMDLKKVEVVEAILAREFPVEPETKPVEQAQTVVEEPVVTKPVEEKPVAAPKARKTKKAVPAVEPQAETIPEPGGRSHDYMLGRAAFGAGEPVGAPMPPGTDADEWFFGWRDARDLAKSEPRFVKVVIVAPVTGVIVDGDTRVEVGTEGLGGSGVEMGGGMGLGGGIELGGGMGTARGAGELGGELTGESTGMGGEGRDATPGGIKKRDGAGCKQPDKVDGWEAGRVLVVVKPHRGEHKAWGTCEYRVRCEVDGTYTLIKLDGLRTSKDLGNLYEGKHWDYVSPMLTDLMGIPRDAAGKPEFHHRMTLRRWFALGRAQ